MRRLLVAWLLLATSVWAQPQRYVLVNGVVHTAREPAFSGWVVVDGDTIESVGRGAPPAGATVDMGGRHLYPALIDADSCLGLVGVESLRATRDFYEVGETNPNLIARYAFRAEADEVAVARSQGVLYSGVNPRRGLICGQGSVMRTWGWNWEEMTVVPSWALAIDYPTMRLAVDAEKRDEVLDAIGRSFFTLNEAMEEAKAYREQELVDAKWGALKPYASGQGPVLLRVGDRDQIASALKWSEEQGIKPVLIAGSKIHHFAEELARRQIPVIYSSLFNENPAVQESYDLHYRTPKLLADKGVVVALSPNGLAFDVREVRDLAGRARAFGLSEVRALQTVTLNPARILGLEKQLGSIEPGKKASLVLCEGDLLEVAPEVVRAWGEGREIDLSDHQKELYETYRRRIREVRE